MQVADLPRADPAALVYKPLCARCYSEDAPDNHVEFACSHDPTHVTGLGMYHCPECSAMVLAGHPHGPICRHCAHETKFEGIDRRRH